MELLVFNNQGISNLAPDDEKDDFGRFDVYISSTVSGLGRAITCLMPFTYDELIP